jgi:TRAP-type C4-dicarboxylate transport system permease small subunit
LESIVFLLEPVHGTVHFRYRQIQRLDRQGLRVVYPSPDPRGRLRSFRALPDARPDVLGLAYTLSRNGHVRGDVLFRLWRPKVQATIELTLYFLFFFPGVLAMIIAGTDYAAESWSYNYGTGEVSINSPANVPISQFKTVLPVAGALLFLQGMAQVCRCIYCLKTGAWPKRLEDVEELEEVLIQQHEEEERRQAAARGDAL